MADNARITIDNLTAEIVLAVKEYTEDVSVAIAKEVDATAAAMVEDLKKDSPKKTGDYAKGWTSKKTKTDEGYGKVIYNKDKPGLTHLLEFGHSINGGKGGRVEAIPHIRPVYDRHVGKFDERIKKIIKSGGDGK